MKSVYGKYIFLCNQAKPYKGFIIAKHLPHSANTTEHYLVLYTSDSFAKTPLATDKEPLYSIHTLRRFLEVEDHFRYENLTSLLLNHVVDIL